MSEMLQQHSWLSPLFGGVVGFIIGVVVGVRYASAIQTSVSMIVKEHESKTFTRTMISVVVGAWVALAGTVGWLAIQDSRLKAHDSAQIEANKMNAYVGCLNANESRQFNIDMWDYILGHELGDTSTAQAPDELVMSEEILPKIHYANRPRDCHNLDRKYAMPEIPDPPGGHVEIVDGKAVLVP